MPDWRMSHRLDDVDDPVATRYRTPMAAATDAVDRIRITTVVDNYIDNLRQDDAVARRYSAFVAGEKAGPPAPHRLAPLVGGPRGGGRPTPGLHLRLPPAQLSHHIPA